MTKNAESGSCSASAGPAQGRVTRSARRLLAVAAIAALVMGAVSSLNSFHGEVNPGYSVTIGIGLPARHIVFGLRVGPHRSFNPAFARASVDDCNVDIFWGECVARSPRAHSEPRGLIREHRPKRDSREESESPQSKWVPPGNSPYFDVPMLLATNRSAVGGNSIVDAFGSDIDTSTYFAELTVTVPRGHVVGRIEEPSTFSRGWRRLFSMPPANPHSHFTIGDNGIIEDRKTGARGEPQFARRTAELIAEGVADEGDRSVLLFVHGCCTDIDWSAKLLAQLVYDTRFPGIPILFSWPSGSSPAGYLRDEVAAVHSVGALKTVLRSLADNGSVERVVVVAHSMGSRVVLEALKSLIAELGPRLSAKVRDLVLAAPDVSTAAFTETFVPAIVRSGMRVTLYASEEDKALLASRIIHGGARAGETGENIVVVRGVETVDATSHIGGFFKHALLITPSVVRDAHGLLVVGLEAERRPTLIGQSHNTIGGRYWRVRNGS